MLRNVFSVIETMRRNRTASGTRAPLVPSVPRRVAYATQSSPRNAERAESIRKRASHEAQCFLLLCGLCGPQRALRL